MLQLCYLQNAIDTQTSLVIEYLLLGRRSGMYKVTISDGTVLSECIENVIFDVVTPDEYGMRNTIRNSITITGKIDIDEKTVSLYQWALLPATNSDCYKKITVEYYQKNVLVREVQFSKAFVVDYTEQYSNHTGVGTFSIYLRQFYKQDIDVTTEETKTVNSEAMVADESEKIEAVQQAENSPVERVVESTNKASMSFTDRVEKQKEMGDNSNEGTSKTWFQKATKPNDYLNEALNRQGLKNAPNSLKEKWSEFGYDFEVRAHPADPKYGKTGSIYRVARRQQGVDANGQGYGWQYMDEAGNWYHTSVLKTNNAAAEATHIQLP